MNIGLRNARGEPAVKIENCGTIVPCILCGARNEATPGLFRCSRCDLFQRAGHEDEGALNGDYAKVDPVARPRFDQRWLAHEVAFLRTHCPEIMQPGHRALDIGTAFGEFVECLDGLGMAACGIEPSPDRARLARAAGLDVRCGRFDPATATQLLGTERFDLISARDCICFFDDFDGAFAEMRRRLDPGGAVYIKMHVADSPYYWGDVPLTHRVSTHVTAFFTSKQILRLVRDRGFRIVATMREDLPAAYIAEIWNPPRRLASLAIRLGAKIVPPDRVHLIARPI